MTPIDMVFPFGHGLSYSTFAYSGLNDARVPAEESARRTPSLDITR